MLMLYCKTINKEAILVHPMNDVANHQYVELTKYGDEPTFSVYMFDDENEYFWEFDMCNPSDYERVKLCIFDSICECDTMEELGCMLNAIFEEVFGEILLVEDCADCIDCEGCGFYQ